MDIKNSRRKFIKSTAAYSALSFLPGIGYLADGNKRINKKIVLRFAVASDGHYGQENTTYEQDYEDIVKWLNVEKNIKGLDLSIFNGDLIHDKAEMLKPAKQKLDQINHTYYVTRGNHDMVGTEVWKNIWGYETNHSFTVKQFAFILADTSNEKGEYLCPDNSWLEEKLHEYRKKKYVFIFMHITPRQWTKFGVDCGKTIELICASKNVAAVFHGHDHNEDAVKMFDNKPFFFDGHFGGSWGTDYKGYRIVEVYDDGSISTYQNNPVSSLVVNEKTMSYP
jgi:3',5'-cyclic AMP phosphodiesterase CpdA